MLNSYMYYILIITVLMESFGLRNKLTFVVIKINFEQYVLF